MLLIYALWWPESVYIIKCPKWVKTLWARNVGGYVCAMTTCVIDYVIRWHEFQCGSASQVLWHWNVNRHAWLNYRLLCLGFNMSIWRYDQYSLLSIYSAGVNRRVHSKAVEVLTVLFRHSSVLRWATQGGRGGWGQEQGEEHGGNVLAFLLWRGNMWLQLGG